MVDRLERAVGPDVWLDRGFARQLWRLSAFVSLTVFACSPGDGARSAPANGSASANERAVAVSVAPATVRDLSRTVTVTGPVQPLRTVTVSGQMSGTLVTVRVEEGDRVRAGQPLAELDARETRAQLERARALLSSAESTYGRSEQLHAAGLITDAQLEEARSSFSVARAEVELWETRLEFTRVLAPAAGVVTVRHVDAGAAVSSNEPLFEIAEDSLLVVRVRVSELDVVHLQAGAPAQVRLDAYPEARIAGRIRRVFPAADAQSRLVPVEVALAPAPGLGVRPGFLARVEFALERRAVLAVPSAAVGVGERGSYVFVVEADTLTRRTVATGTTAGEWVEVRAGLESGDAVVTSGHSNLRSGLAVRVSGGATLREGS